MKLKEAVNGSLVKQVLKTAEKNRIFINADDLAWFMAYTDADNMTSGGIKDLARTFYEGGYEQMKGNIPHMEQFIETYLEDDRAEGMSNLMNDLSEFFAK